MCGAASDYRSRTAHSRQSERNRMAASAQTLIRWADVNQFGTSFQACPPLASPLSTATKSPRRVAVERYVWTFPMAPLGSYGRMTNGPSGVGSRLDDDGTRRARYSCHGAPVAFKPRSSPPPRIRTQG